MKKKNIFLKLTLKQKKKKKKIGRNNTELREYF